MALYEVFLSCEFQLIGSQTELYRPHQSKKRCGTGGSENADAIVFLAGIDEQIIDKWYFYWFINISFISSNLNSSCLLQLNAASIKCISRYVQRPACTSGQNGSPSGIGVPMREPFARKSPVSEKLNVSKDRLLHALGNRLIVVCPLCWVLVFQWVGQLLKSQPLHQIKTCTNSRWRARFVIAVGPLRWALGFQWLGQLLKSQPLLQIKACPNSRFSVQLVVVRQL